jgi:hypothetical protein
MSEQREPVPASSWLTPALLHAAIVAGLFRRLIVSMPEDRRELDRWHAAIPFVTQLVFGLSEWMVHYWWAAAGPAAVLLALDAILLWRMGGWKRRAAWLWTWGAAGSLLTFWAACELAVLLAMRKASEGARDW